MVSFDIVKPLFTVQSSNTINKFHQHQEKNSWECRESNLGMLGAKQERYPLHHAPPSHMAKVSYTVEIKLSQ